MKNGIAAVAYTLFMVTAVWALASCGGGGGGTTTVINEAPYTVGGTISGLAGSVVLKNNNGDNLTVAANGNFTFVTPVTNGNAYNVTVLAQPVGQTCSVSTGAGTVSGNNVTNATVVCSVNSYSVGGTVTGLVGSLVLQNNNGDNLTFAANGGFTFATTVAHGSPYNVTVLTQPVGQSCSVASGSGTISAANVGNVAITCATNTYTVGGTVSGLSGTLVLQDNGGDNLTVAVNGTFSFATAVAYGNPYNVTVLTQPAGQLCSITGGSGTVMGNVSNAIVNCAIRTSPRYAFTANQTDNSVSTYAVDNASGRLKYIGKVAAGVNPTSVTVDPSGRFAYVANGFNGAGGNSVSQYTIGVDGILTPMIPATVAAGTRPSSVIVDPSGKYVYVVNNGSSNISQYSISSNGALTAMSTVAAGTSPASITFNPNGGNAYVANSGSNDITQYIVNSTNGGLVAMTLATIATGSSPFSITVEPSGKFAYVVCADGSVWDYIINASTGALSRSTGMPPSPSIYFRHSIAIDPSGKYAYVTGYNNTLNSNFVITYGINASTGSLTYLGIAVTGMEPFSVAVDPSGKYVYVTNRFTGAGGNSVSQYVIAANGALTPLSPATVSNMTGPISITVAAGAQPVQAVPKYAYVANSVSNTVSQYSIGASGDLVPMTPPTVATGTTPSSVTVDPSGKYAYVANSFNGAGGNSVSQYSIAANGTLTPMTTATVAAGTSPSSVTVDPSGKYAYVTNTGSGSISQYSIDANGALVPMATASVPSCNATTALVCASTFPQLPWPVSVTVDPSGRYVYVANLFSFYNVSQFAIGATGALIRITHPDVKVGANPYSVTVHPSGKYAYIANSFNGVDSLSGAVGNSVSQYTIDATGMLTPMVTATVPAGTSPISVTIEPSGKYAYAANKTSNDVSQYTIGVDGALTPMTPATIAAGTSPSSVTVDPSGKYVYVTNNGGANISQYLIGAGGALSPMTTATVTAGSGPTAVTTTGTWQ